MKYAKRIGLGLTLVGLALMLALAVGTAFPTEDVAVLLEKAIYTEETLGDLDAAIGIYRQIVDGTEPARTTAAQALYRMGMCYRKSGNKQEAESTFAQLTKLYPEQKELLARIPAPVTATTPQFGPAPWADGELLTYLANSKSYGGLEQTHIIASARHEGKPGWEFSLIEAMNMPNINVARMDSKYVPKETRNLISNGESSSLIRFFPDRVEENSMPMDEVIRSAFPQTRTAYAAMQMPYLLRTLPLKDGYETTLPVYNGRGSVYDTRIWVEGREKVTVAAGTFDCFKVAAKKYSGKFAYWISIDAPFYIVKFETMAGHRFEFELKSIAQLEKSRPVDFEDTESGIRLSAPPEWFVSRGAALIIQKPDEANLALSIFDPYGKAVGVLVIGDIKMLSSDEDGNSPQQTLSAHIDQVMNGYRQNQNRFQVYDREDFSGSGLSGIRFLIKDKVFIDGVESLIGGDDRMIDTRVFQFQASKKVGLLRFYTAEDDYDRLHPMFDDIVNSIQIK